MYSCMGMNTEMCILWVFKPVGMRAGTCVYVCVYASDFGWASLCVLTCKCEHI